LVVPGAEFDRIGRFQGFSGEVDRYLETLLAPGVAGFRPRFEVEDDPSLKQIIPYVVFTTPTAVFCYRRGKSQGEARLHHLRSLGVGGHVAEEDCQGKSTLEGYELALKRELDEEVELLATGENLRVGLINDDSTPVGRVHLGVIHHYRIDRPALVAREAGLADAEFVELGALGAIRGEFETWSQICIDSFLMKR
jgi:predicted NUDIX family phosphoesterase